MRGSVCFGLRHRLRTGAPEAVRPSELATERGATARADHGRWVLRLHPRPARRRPERDRATPGVRCGVPLARWTTRYGRGNAALLRRGSGSSPCRRREWYLTTGFSSVLNAHTL